MIKNEEIEKLKQDLLLRKFESPEELRDWVWLYFDLYMPMGHMSDEANSSSVESMWEIYKAVRDNTGDKIPGYTLLSSRDSYKTLSASILEVILLIHFRCTIAHCAAIISQSQKSVEYINNFVTKIMPYLTAKGWKRSTQNKMRIELLTDKNEMCYIQVIVLTMRGANSAHTNLLFVDEVDLVQPQAYQEAKMIPGVARGRFPLTIRLSTRKFAFGLMEQEIQKAPITGEKVIRWNILDVTEYCPPSRCLPEEPTKEVFVRRELPLGYIEKAEYEGLDVKERDKYQSIQAYQGCLSCPLLSACKKKLHTHKTPDMVGDLWKPIPAVINVIRQVNPDVGEAQLLCHKPSTTGLIYPRFNNMENVWTIQQAWESISGNTNKIHFNQFIDFIKSLGVPIEAGVDWGFTHQFAIIVAARLSNGVCLILDKFAAPGLELSDCVRIGKEMKEKYGIQRFWCDTAYPAYVKTYNKEGLVSPHFEKDVPRGISAVREKIIDGVGTRKFFILDTENNDSLIKGVMTYHWKLDSAGNPTDKPDHTEEADEMDALRYLVDNMFGFKNKLIFTSVNSDTSLEKPKIKTNSSLEEMAKEVNRQIVQNKISELAPERPKEGSAKGKGRKILWV